MSFPLPFPSAGLQVPGCCWLGLKVDAGSQTQEEVRPGAESSGRWVAARIVLSFPEQQPSTATAAGEFAQGKG